MPCTYFQQLEEINILKTTGINKIIYEQRMTHLSWIWILHVYCTFAFYLNKWQLTWIRYIHTLFNDIVGKWSDLENNLSKCRLLYNIQSWKKWWQLSKTTYLHFIFIVYNNPLDLDKTMGTTRQDHFYHTYVHNLYILDYVREATQQSFLRTQSWMKQ